MICLVTSGLGLGIWFRKDNVVAGKFFVFAARNESIVNWKMVKYSLGI